MVKLLSPFSSSVLLSRTQKFNLLSFSADGGKDEKMDTSPPAEDKKGEVHVGAREAGRSDPVALPQEEKISQCVVVLLRAEPKEEDSVKADEPGKLQNGESAKDGVAAVSVVNVGEEKKKTTKQRFMFNIADGGFTGGWLHTHAGIFYILSLFVLSSISPVFLFVFFSQSFTPCGRTRRGQPPSPRRPLRFGTAATTTGSLPASSSILRRRDQPVKTP